MKSALLILACGILLAVVLLQERRKKKAKRSEEQARQVWETIHARNQRFLRDLYTKVEEHPYGTYIETENTAVAADIMLRRYCGAGK